ncbi:ABC transporter permease [Nitrosopumilus sp.]|uniref:ABC transporter permease n=1 Tax=Nitrosopumilus sp. TaxID=2024843 RepID=UPI0029302E7A|nr:ABC transporter permease [Nitrosopumilus sp.]
MKLKPEFAEIWEKRLLLWNFAITDLKVRYKNSVLGFFWSFLEPLLLLVILYFVFTNVFSFEIENYALYLLGNLILWNFFVRSTNFGMTSMLSKAGILSKIYFPREIVVLSSVLTSLLMLGLELIAFGFFFVVFQFMPTITILFMPIPIIILSVLVLGISFSFSVVNVFFRDLQSIWTIVIQAVFFLTPIIYKMEILPKILQDILYYSPLVRIFEMFHNSILYNKLPSEFEIIYTSCLSIVILLVGYFIFSKLQAKSIEEL